MNLIPGMNEKEKAKYGKLIEAFEKAKKTGEPQQFSCVGLEKVVYVINGERKVYDEKGKFLFTYSAEVFKEIPKEENN